MNLTARQYLGKAVDILQLHLRRRRHARQIGLHTIEGRDLANLVISLLNGRRQSRAVLVVDRFELLARLIRKAQRRDHLLARCGTNLIGRLRLLGHRLDSNSRLRKNQH